MFLIRLLHIKSINLDKNIQKKINLNEMKKKSTILLKKIQLNKLKILLKKKI